MNRHDVRVLKFGREADFPEESLASEYDCQAGLEHLDGDRAVVTEIVRQVDDGHTAPPDLALDPVRSRYGGLQLRGWVHETPLKSISVG
jgi:hypothetical protein